MRTIVATLLIASSIASAGPVRTKVRASEVDPEVKSYPEIGFVLEEDGEIQDYQYASFDQGVSRRDELVIWLMGHNSELSDFVTARGFHYIGVHYPRQWFSKLCRENPEEGNCRGNVRLEAATGEDFSSELDLAYRDSIAGRSLALVKWLAKEDRKSRWSRFLTKDKKDLQWEKVVLAGASHGATTAARFAKHEKVARVICFAGPRDHLQTWQAESSATPAARYFGFSHVEDGGWIHDHYPRSWKMLGLEAFGPIVDVDATKPPYGGSRMLTTAIDVGDDHGRAHNCVQPGSRAQRNDGSDGKKSYLHAPVWEYMFTSKLKE